MRLQSLRNSRGSALIIALVLTGVVAAVAASTTVILQKRHRQAYQTAAWQEALLASEAGVDMAVNQLRASIYDPTGAFSEWHQVAGSEEESLDGVSVASGTTGLPLVGTKSYYTSTLFLRSSEGGQSSWCEVEIDAPAFLLNPSTGEQWYRVRSLGIAEIPGGSVLVGDKEDLKLRKFDLNINRRTKEPIRGKPQATRLVEVIVKPMGVFSKALLSDNLIDLNNANIVVDSYDSEDTAKSTGGKYDPAKRQSNGDIATNGTLIQGGSAHIYGDAATNVGGTVLGADNITGDITDDFYQELSPVVAPTFVPEAGSPSNVTGTTTLAAAANDPANYLLSSIKLSGTKTLTITGAPDKSPRFATIVVTGDISMAGQSQIILEPGVYLRIFVKGDADIAGQGVANSGSALNFQLYGAQRTDGTTGNIKIAGNGAFTGSVYAPDYDVNIVGGGTTDSVFGAFVAKNVRMTGVQSVHYDELLSRGGLISDYKIASWFEDTN